MPLIKTRAKIGKGTLRAEVKYPLVGGAELNLSSIGAKLKTLIKVPFLFSAKLFGIYTKKRKNR